jgi:catechol 2,3-dioxygenase-like lactoylglutathione lyase family enzyme
MSTDQATRTDRAASDALAFCAIDHVQLAMPAGGEDLAEKFYSDILGFTLMEKPLHLRSRGGCWFAFDCVQVHLGVDPDFTPARKAHPAFLVSSLRALKRRLEEANVGIVLDTPLDGYDRCYASDPFGNRLEFMERVK